MKHEEFARKVAARTAYNIPGQPVEIEDAVQLGLEALVVSANRFDFDGHDPSLGELDTQFRSFAYLRIYGAVIDEARRNTFVKRRGIEKGAQVTFVPLDAPLQHEDGETVIDLVALTGDPDLILDFEAGLASLDPRERYVVLALAAGVKGRELATELGITESRISQISTEAKAKLITYMEEAA